MAMDNSPSNYGVFLLWTGIFHCHVWSPEAKGSNVENVGFLSSFINSPNITHSWCQFMGMKYGNGPFVGIPEPRLSQGISHRIHSNTIESIPSKYRKECTITNDQPVWTMNFEPHLFHYAFVNPTMNGFIPMEEIPFTWPWTHQQSINSYQP